MALSREDAAVVSWLPQWTAPDMLTAVLLHRVLLTRLCTVLALAVGIRTLVSRTTFTSSATLATPPAGLNVGGLGGIAAQLGLGLGMSGMSRPPEFYASFAGSDAVMQGLVQQTYLVPDGDTTCRCDLVHYFGLDDKPRPLAVELAGKSLQKRLSAMVAKETGTIEITSRFGDAALAQEVGRRLLDAIDQYNVRERYERATAERRFLEGRLDSARTSQRAAEDELERFLATNRDFKNSPSLQVRFERLNREAQLRQQLTASITDSYEKARLDESRSTGVLVVVAPPSLPAQRDPRFLIVKVFAALIVGLALGTVLAWWLEIRRGDRGGGYPPEVARAIRDSFWRDARRPWVLLTGSGSAPELPGGGRA